MGIGRKACGILSTSSMNKKMSKLKTLLHLTVCRLAILKNQRRARCNHARDDLLQLLQLGHRNRALLRAELVVKEENMLDAFAMLEGYCKLVTERSVLLRGQKVCPDELREAVSGLVYASSRLGDLPELYHVRNVFSSMLGKDFTDSAVEIRNNCVVNPKIVQKLSTRQPSLESRVRITKEIATSKGITLDLVYDNSTNCPDNKHKPTMQVDPSSNPKRRDSLGRGKYKDAVSAALAAFESAEDAAAAAKAAVELSQSSQTSFGDHRQSGSDCSPMKEDKIDSNKAMDDPVRDSTSELDKEDAVEYFSNMQLYPDEHREINNKKSNTTSESGQEDAVEYFSSNVRLYSNEDKVEKNKSNSTSESEEENPKYFSHMQLYPDEHEDEKKSFRSLKRSPYSSTGGPLHEQVQEEDTFELAILNERSKSEIEKPSLRGWMFNAELALDSPDKHAAPNLNPTYRKSNSVTKNRENLNSSVKLESEDRRLLGSAKWGRHSVSSSSETRSFHSEIGQVESADILPTKTSRALSVRTRRGLQR